MVKGFAALGSYQCGVEGMETAMSPDSREIESVCGNASASRRPLCFYFSFEAILEEIIRARLKGRDDGGMLPPRKFWSRPSLRERACGLNAKTSRRMAVRRRVLLEQKRGTLASQVWGAKLLAFVREVQTRVFDGPMAFTPPKMISIVKGVDETGRKTYREVASFESLSDRVILNRLTAYLRDRLDPLLTPNCYAFRRDGRITHETAVADLQSWRMAHAGGPMWIAECDILKFFDSISHATVLRRWAELLGEDGEAGVLALPSGDMAVALRVVQAYLDVYSTVETGGRGLPQGGSLSVVLANLILCAADQAVLAADDTELFYARYCDDVVFAHPDAAKCRAAMAAYERALEKLDLPMHPVEAFTYKQVVRRKRCEHGYYEFKSKGPFLWAAAETGVGGVAPWVSFLGSQVKYDGETRIRRESVVRHVRALGRATAEAVREVASEDFSRKDAAAVRKWFGCFRNRLIARGVGYVTAKYEDCIGCWVRAFGQVTRCDETRRQMRYLDRVRERMLCKVWHLVVRRIGKGRRRFKGQPFSYHAFLMREFSRPTNLRWKAVRGRYSEL